MLDDKELEKLCHGCTIKAKTYNSSETDATDEHFAIVIATNEQIAKGTRFRVVFISSNTSIDSTNVMPVPGITGLKGFIIGSWAPFIEEAAITEVRRVPLLAPDMRKVLELVRRADAAKKAKDTTQP